MDQWVALVGSRFIPARAGSTPRSGIRRCRTTVHPRSRGEHPLRIFPKRLVLGSSPLARGARHQTHGLAVQFRFIPARAGSTRRPTSRSTKPTVHPRSRGEHPITAASVLFAFGSSPLVRGALQPRPVGLLPGRFIPAHAGSTWADGLGHARGSVHPRSRGEHDKVILGILPAGGSSPLARGARTSALADVARRRFIPARAGSTFFVFQHPDTLAVHPRSRGEHQVMSVDITVPSGSSPLARGAR